MQGLPDCQDYNVFMPQVQEMCLCFKNKSCVLCFETKRCVCASRTRDVFVLQEQEMCLCFKDKSCVFDNPLHLLIPKMAK